jgi:hypothetical protein
MHFEGRIARAVCVSVFVVGVAACGDEDPAEEVLAFADANRAPVITGKPTTSIIAGHFYDFMPAASDPDGDPLIFGINGAPDWLAFDTASGRLSGMPGTTDVGTHPDIKIWASDGIDDSMLPTLQITVLPAAAAQNRAPIIAGSPATSVTAGSFYDFIPVVSDPDGDALSFSVANLPPWATFDSEIGRLSGTPGAGQIGAYGNVVISAFDGIATADLEPFVIVVNPLPSQNTAPTISGVPGSSVLLGYSYSFTPTFSDMDGDRLTFSVINPPEWAQFDSTNGTLSGTPLQSHVGRHGGVSIVVSDGEATDALPSFSIEVIDPNSPPTISGVPSGSVLVGDSYRFVPTASDPDGDSLSFRITGLPVWASFNTATGELSGSLSAQHAGTYDDIVITADDGTASATLGPFSITVAQSGTGTAALSWTPPTQNTDGSPLNDLNGYVVYWGTASGSYQNSTTLANPGLTSYVVENLVPGTTYYFATKAYNSDGLESSFSNEASKTIP